MSAELPARYLAALPAVARAALARANEPGLAALRRYLDDGDAIAFLGAGVSAPLYRLWDGLVAELIRAGASVLDDQQAATLRGLAGRYPEEVAEIVRIALTVPSYQGVLRQVFQVRKDPESGRTWTPVHELVCRCSFKGIVTTNYDPGIMDARMAVRPNASTTAFAIWQSDDALDRWRRGDEFRGDDPTRLPILCAHGLHSWPETIVLATTEYRRAYGQGKLAHVLRTLVDSQHLVWIGFSFADQRIAAILREVAQASGSRIDPGPDPRHVAIMPWDPEAADADPRILVQVAAISYGAKLVLYPAPRGNHAALAELLEELTDPRFPAPGRGAAGGLAAGGLAGSAPSRPVPESPSNPLGESPAKVMWSTRPEVSRFVGRAEELAKLDRWAADPQVRLIGVTALGGAGKTALVSHWLQQGGGLAAERARAVFGWSFNKDPSAERFAAALLEWAAVHLGVLASPGQAPAAAVLTLLRKVPLLLVLDGLEVVQEGQAEGFGRLLDGTLRNLLTAVCQLDQPGLVVLTSRFPFADLLGFAGSSVRTLDIPPLTPAEGAELIAEAAGGWLSPAEREELSEMVDGHPLGVTVLAEALASRPGRRDLAALRTALADARTDARVTRVLQFYSEGLPEAARFLLAAVSLFSYPVAPATLLSVARHPVFGGRLSRWTTSQVQEVAQSRLEGLVSVHEDGTLSAHPLVRDAFRPLVLGAAQVAADLTLTGVPGGQATNRAEGLRVVECLELLLEAGLWTDADKLYQASTDDGKVWRKLPAAQLGQRAAVAFIKPGRPGSGGVRLGPGRMGFYLESAGLYAMLAGDMEMAREYLTATVHHLRDTGNTRQVAAALDNLATCLAHLGETGRARDTAQESLRHASIQGDQPEMRICHADLGWVAGLGGDIGMAEEQFAAADRIQLSLGQPSEHLYSVPGARWADFLARTGRLGPARRLTEHNRAVCELNGMTRDVAICDRLMGRFDLASGHPAQAAAQLERAAARFRDGDMVVELADLLPDLADCARLSGQPEQALRHVAEALAIAAPRGLIPAQSAALAARARVHAARFGVGAGPQHLASGRDDADDALRLARSGHQLAWCELAALRVHARLDRREGRDRGWQERAEVLRRRLIPEGLDPDPPATVLRQFRSAEPDAEPGHGTRREDG